MTFYHYTCDHGHAALLAEGATRNPAADLPPERIAAMLPEGFRWMAEVIWFTDLRTPNREALGLTSNYTSCDRTVYRWKATDVKPLIPWSIYRLRFPRDVAAALESPGKQPKRWWVAERPVPVVYSPSLVRA